MTVPETMGTDQSLMVTSTAGDHGSQLWDTTEEEPRWFRCNISNPVSTVMDGL